MSDRVPCPACGAPILLSTAEKNGGLCMPCKGGYRKSIDASKIRYEQDKRFRESSEHKHWQWLVDQVHNTETGFSGLSHGNQLYFATNLVSGEVYNGGFDQYFHNSSADYFRFAVEGLMAIGASKSLALLTEAKKMFFGDAEVPSDTCERRSILRATDSEAQVKRDKELDVLDRAFWADPDKLGKRMSQFAKDNELHKNF
ncbi:DMP19 family protein [Methylomonas sp. MED-D]|uniref:DMP19 family protein n=1 Tax=unclassified Methylomonas TaxID=2608980 RepID=UPI0028A550AA|nr:DMP19 family protein [Methylomonas sp. MV1]MDT4332445.1 DMP19 family protein [Methylomonas sp. MV1]